MKLPLRINKKYLIITLLLFCVEVLIALYVHDDFVRPYIGDVLVVMLIYCFIRSFFDFPVVPTALGVLLFAFAVEAAQYFNIVDRLDLSQNKVAAVLIGTSFAWEDIIAYTAGACIILLAEKG